MSEEKQKQRKTKTKKDSMAKTKRETIKSEIDDASLAKSVKEDQKENMSNSSVKQENHLVVEVFSSKGKKTGTMTLPESLFAGDVNNQLMAQAVRVYLANQREGSASTKTRGEVEGSTRKIYRQKGTGRARHGSIRAPIFVKGGIVFGPKPRDYSLRMPKKMKKKALVSALTVQCIDHAIKVITEIDSLEVRTKVFHELFELLRATKSTLFLLGKDDLIARRAMRNLPYVDVVRSIDVNTYDILSHRDILMTKDALQELQEVMI